ncbi:MAG: GreA/GreB family elongation factor [Alphaproteobacteria bacterium]|nr:GreA/GreB family elongation factor [Alphaproteobacteria bacterium]MCB9691453.1 GreA/GreB family elongation factor [Alphaproteobacteria bacterium]
MDVHDKGRILIAFRTSLQARLEANATMTALARDEATSEESRAENKYDTRALEASYMAAGQGERLESLRALVAWLEGVVVEPHRAVGPATLVRAVSDAGVERTLFLAPQGGERIELDGEEVELLGLGSPLGRALAGMEADDEVEVDTPGGVARWALDEVV